MSALAVPLLAQTGGGGGSTQLLLLVVMAVVFYLLLVRPQQKRARDQRNLLAALGAGDRVITIGGIHGTVVDIDEETVRIEVAPGTVLTMARQAIGRRLTDDLDSADEDADSPIDDADRDAVGGASLETDGTGSVSSTGDTPSPNDQR